MKIRLGFVSNSSSASYTVTLHCIPDKARDMIVVVADSYLGGYNFDNAADPHSLLGRLDNTITYTRSQITTIETQPNSIVFEHKDILERRLAQAEKDKAALQRIGTDWIENKDEMVDIICRNLGITITYYSEHATLKDFTSMHNSFCEGMSRLLQELVLESVFHKEIKVSCKVQHDG